MYEPQVHQELPWPVLTQILGLLPAVDFPSHRTQADTHTDNRLSFIIVNNDWRLFSFISCIICFLFSKQHKKGHVMNIWIHLLKFLLKIYPRELQFYVFEIWFFLRFFCDEVIYFIKNIYIMYLIFKQNVLRILHNKLLEHC